MFGVLPCRRSQDARRAPSFMMTAIAGGVLCGLVSACGGAPTGTTESDAQGGAQTILLAKNLVGEECRAQPNERSAFEGLDYQSFEVFCGGWEQSSGRILSVPRSEGDADPRQAVQTWATSGLWRQTLDQRMNCDTGSWSQMLDQVDVFVLTCALKKGNWPYIAVAATLGDRIFLADGIPSTQPAIEDAIARLGVSGSLAPRADQVVFEGSKSNLIAKLETELGESARFGTGDIGAYDKLMQLGQLYNSIKNFSGAEQAYRRALAIQEQAFGADSPEVGDVLLNLALEVSNQARFDEAAALFDRAKPLVDASVDRADIARFMSYRSLDAANRRSYEEALEFAQQATKLRRELVADQLEEAERREQARASQGVLGVVGALPVDLVSRRSSDVAEIAQSRYVEAAMLMRLNRTQEAREAISDAIDIISGSRRAPEWWFAQVRQLDGEILADQGDLAGAEEAILDSLTLRKQLFGETRPTALSYLALGDVLLRQDRPAQALTAFRQATGIIEDDTTSSTLLNFERMVPYLDSLLRQAAANPEERDSLYNEAFVASQLQQAGVTGQTIARTAARLASTDPQIGALVRQLQEAVRARDEIQLELGTETTKEAKDRNPERERELQERLAQSAVRARELEQQLQAAYPRYAQLISTRPLSAEDISKGMRPDEALASVAILDSVTYVFLVRNGKVSISRAELGTAEVDEAVALLRQAFTIQGGSIFEYDLGLAYRLYTALFGSLEAELDGVRHLIYVPTGSLLSLPLGVLVREPPVGQGEAGYLQASWVAKDMSVSVLPSVRAFLDLRLVAGQSRAPRPFVGFGNPIFDGFAAPVRVSATTSGPIIPRVAADRSTAEGTPDRPDAAIPGGPEGPGQPLEQDQQASIVAPQTRNLSEAMAALCAGGRFDPASILRQLAPLPETEDELRRVASILGGGTSDVITRTDASEARVAATDLSQYRVIYFATHGLLPGELRCQAEAALALTPPAEPSELAGDGLLSTSDIVKLNLDADLVVLSACNTGGPSGRMGGESLSGLAQSFFYAGARRLMVSHWVVPSLATVQLTTGMFERFATAGSSESLRLAQIALIEDRRTAHPFFWGAFTIVGDGGVGLAGQ